MSVKMMIKCILVMKSCILYFLLFSSFCTCYFIFYSPKQGNSLNFPSMEYTINNMSARE